MSGRHVLEHMPGQVPSYLFKQVPRNVLRYMPNKYMFEHVPGPLWPYGLGCTNDMAPAHYRKAHAEFL